MAATRAVALRWAIGDSRRVPLQPRACLGLLIVVAASCVATDTGSRSVAIGDPFPGPPPVPLPSIVPAEPVGAIPGAIEVTPDGAATYAIGIRVPPGRGGLEPNLALLYSSRGSDGFLGVGWSLSGISAVTRCRRTINQDGFVREIHFDNEDAFCLDGQRLVAVRGSYGSDGTEYRTEHDRFARIISRGEYLGGPAEFEALMQDGRILRFGTTDDSRVEGWIHTPVPRETVRDRRAVLAWSVSSVEDRVGNRTSYQYTRTEHPDDAVEHRPARILYTFHPEHPAANRAIDFVYDSRAATASPRRTFLAGFKSATTHLLTSIVASGPNPVTAAPVWSYRLKYSRSGFSGRPLLTEVSHCDGYSICMPPTMFGYSADAADRRYAVHDLDVPVAFDEHSAVLLSDTTVFRTFVPLDVNGDGATDVLHCVVEQIGQQGEGRYSWWLRTSDGTTLSRARPSGLQFNTDACAGEVLPLDINGDGLTDVLHQELGAEGTSVYRFYVSTGERLELLRDPVLDDRVFRSRSAPLVADLDGNNLPDAVWTDGDVGSTWEYRIHDTTHYGPFQDSFVASFDGPAPIVMDYDGDGRTEFLTAGTNADPPSFGDSYTAVRVASGTVPSSFATNVIFDADQMFVDVNGDGLTDSVVFRDDFELSNRLRIRLNTGRGFGREYDGRADDTFFVPRPTRTVSASHRDLGVRVLDANGDGNFDLLLLYESDRGLGFESLLLFSNGERFILGDSSMPAGAFVEGWSTTTTVDFDADGHSDVLQARNVRGSFYALRVLRQPSGVRDTLTDVVDGLGARDSVEYQPLTGAEYRPGTGCAFPQVCIRGATFPVVSRVNYDNGVGSSRLHTYAYADGRADLHGRGWVGFAERTITDIARHVVTRTTFDNRTVDPNTGLYIHAGMPLAETRTLSTAGDVVHSNIARYEYGTRSTSAGVSHIRQVDTTYESYETVSEGGVLRIVRTRSTRLRRSYDDFGELTRESTEIDGRPYRDWEGFYLRNLDRWLINVLLEERITAHEPGRPSVERRTVFVPDPVTGQVLESTEMAGVVEAQIHTTYSWYPDGNLRRLVATDSFGNERAVDYEYDGDGIHARRVTLPLGHVQSYQHHPSYGVVVAHTNPNGVQLQWQYDGFGRMRAELRPDGASQFVSYVAAPVGMEVTVATSGYPRLRLVYDALERPVLEEWPGYDGRLINRETVYDIFGRVSHSARPHFESEPARFATFKWDNLDRPTSLVGPDGSAILYAYGPNIVEVIDPRGAGSRYVQDSLGRLTTSSEELIDPGGTRWLDTQYQYEPFDLLYRVIDPRGNVTTTEHDSAGRVLRIDEPNSGTTRFGHNGFGEVTSRLDGRSDLATYDRDPLGRVTEARIGTDVITYNWDTEEHGIGALGSTERAGITTTFGYDAFGRINAQEQIWPDGTRLAYGYDYDAHGRLGSIIYPTADGAPGFVVQHEYNDDGYLRRILANGRPVTTVIRRAPDGALLEELYGNGARNVRDHGPADGRVRQLDIFGLRAGADSDRPGSPRPPVPVQLVSIGYRYDPSGNLESRADRLSGQLETFAYDSIDRLRTWAFATLDGRSRTAQYSYDDVGNLTFRRYLDGSTLQLQYGERGFGPHAVTSTTHTPRGGGFEFRAQQDYDVIGRMTDGFMRTLSYAPHGEPNLIEGRGVRLEITHDALGRRAMAERTGGAMELEFADLFARRTDGGVPEDEYTVVTPDGRPIALFTRRSTSASFNATYLHHDFQDSVVLVTDSRAREVRRLRYDPHGVRIKDNGDAETSATPETSDIGYSSWEVDDDIGLIIMGYRPYDPAVGRFLAPDNVVSRPYFGESLNRYSYALNNPTRYVDPDGLQSDVFADPWLPHGTPVVDRIARQWEARYTIARDRCVGQCDMPQVGVARRAQLDFIDRVFAPTQHDSQGARPPRIDQTIGNPVLIAECAYDETAGAASDGTVDAAAFARNLIRAQRHNATVDDIVSLTGGRGGPSRQTAEADPEDEDGVAYVNGPWVAPIDTFDASRETDPHYLVDFYSSLEVHAEVMGANNGIVESGISIPLRIRRATARLGGGLGAYWQTKGHHVLMKAIQRFARGYTPGRGFSISPALMDLLDLNHGAVSNAQNTLLRQAARGGRTITYRQHIGIAIKSLIAGGLSKHEARWIVSHAVAFERERGIKHYPLYNPYHPTWRRTLASKRAAGRLRPR